MLTIIIKLVWILAKLDRSSFNLYLPQSWFIEIYSAHGTTNQPILSWKNLKEDPAWYFLGSQFSAAGWHTMTPTLVHFGAQVHWWTGSPCTFHSVANRNTKMATPQKLGMRCIRVKRDSLKSIWLYFPAKVLSLALYNLDSLTNKSAAQSSETVPKNPHCHWNILPGFLKCWISSITWWL